MDLLEYQGKELFAKYDIPVSSGKAVENVDDAVAVANEVGYPVVVKAQVLVGGRGKAGGIKLANNEEEAREHANAILGMDIKGHIVKVLWVEHASDIAEEYYASFTLDRAAKKHLGMLSAQGGVEIEVVAEENPDAISKIWIDPSIGLTIEQCQAWVEDAKLNPQAKEGAVDILLKLYNAYVKGDCDLAEINPLILTPEGKVHALDAKVTLDENAIFRHEEWKAYEVTQELDPREKLAKEKGLNYIGLDGEIGIIGNGAGLVMSTLDIVNQVGGRPANFLDVGGGADAELLANAIEVVNSDENVKAIFLNIFGGITKCDDVANGVIEATSRVELKSPIVVRLDGTNVEEGRAILDAHPNEKIVFASTMLNAAKKAVELSK
ncbi:MAG: ADP-forming succinate--CoA ligase subunit beta [Acidimicrobiia bacterium]